MNNKKDQILVHINNLSSFKKLGYLFELYDFTKYNSDSPKTSSIAFQSENLLTNRRIHITYMPEDAFGNQSHIFWCIISSINSDNSLSFYLDKYLSKKYGEQFKNAKTLYFYEGSFEKKIEQFFIFFEKVMSECFIVEILAGKVWSNDYYTPLWENYNR